LAPPYEIMFIEKYLRQEPRLPITVATHTESENGER